MRPDEIPLRCPAVEQGFRGLGRALVKEQRQVAGTPDRTRVGDDDLGPGDIPSQGPHHDLGQSRRRRASGGVPDGSAVGRVHVEVSSVQGFLARRPGPRAGGETGFRTLPGGFSSGGSGNGPGPNGKNQYPGHGPRIGPSWLTCKTLLLRTSPIFLLVRENRQGQSLVGALFRSRIHRRPGEGDHKGRPCDGFSHSSIPLGVTA